LAAFPFLLGRAFIEASLTRRWRPSRLLFPCFFVGTFIETGLWKLARLILQATFLRPGRGPFIEVLRKRSLTALSVKFPVLFGGTFNEGTPWRACLRVNGYFPSFSEGLSLRAAHPGLRGQHLNLSFFGGAFPNLSLLRSWTHHSPGTELFRYMTRLKPQPQPPPASCYPPPPHIQAEKLNTPTLRHKLADKPKHSAAVLPSKPSSQS